MFTLDFDALSFELKDGAVKHMGLSNKAVTAKLYDVADADARVFGDERVKLVFADDEGNEVEVALFPEQASALKRQIESLEGETGVFE
ncbi:hypothetical protein VB773_07060 [Haloarculaceae archaeon H-GB2-1]|nr:hypothetical protein [Haloarculaceae archaeon H-GB1-1]MEA5385847.1 hypothetical protein [Haloarculaceae archaeon H-GB11]MEA5407350.1 hypothetical protein [Haloarculaceae archaeon H-GB2-1]